MKKRLRDITKDDFTLACRRNLRDGGYGCGKCCFDFLCNGAREKWEDYKNMLQDIALDREIEISEPIVQLTQEEKDYLKNAFKYCNSENITIRKKDCSNIEEGLFYILADIELTNGESLCSVLPTIKSETMFSAMLNDERYDLKVLLDENKIKLSTILKSSTKVAIHCDCRWKAEDLFEACRMLGKEWNDNKNGTDSCFWGRYEEDTYYSNDTGYAMNKAFCERLHYTIYEFEDIDLYY